MKIIKIVCFGLLISLSSVSGVQAKNVLDYLTEAIVVDNQNIECPACRFVNKPDASFCAGCGNNSSHLSQNSIQCPYCDREFRFTPSYAVSFCSACGIKSQPGAIFCSNCGASLHLIKCPGCYKEIKTLSHKRSLRPGRKSQVVSSRQVVDNSQIKLAEFVKKDNGNYKERYDISMYTGGRAFSKIVMEQTIGEGHGVIVNTIKVEHLGNWAVIPATTRLKEGYNEFSVNIPQGARQISISYNHGRSSKVIVYIQ